VTTVSAINFHHEKDTQMTATATRRAPRRSKATTPPAKPGPATGVHVKVDRKALRFAIKGSGLTHAQIAALAKFKSAATISNLVCTGAKGGDSERGTCRPETAKAISKALGLDVEDHREIFQVVLTHDS